MKKLLSCILALFLISSAFAICSFAASNDVYVKDGGSGDGTSSTSPVGTLTAAFEKAAAMSGKATIHVVDTVSWDLGTAEFAPVAHTNTITVTGGKIVVTGSAKFWTITGPTVFENIEFNLAAIAHIRTRGNDLTFGKGVVMSDKTWSIRMYGSDDNLAEGSLTGSTNITLLSGSYYDVSAFQKGFNTPINGTMNVTVGGTAFVNVLVVDRSAVNTAGRITKAVFKLDGGTIGRFVANSDNVAASKDGAVESFKVIVTKNFDIDAQNTDQYPVISGSSAAVVGNTLNGAEGSCKTILEVDAEIYDKLLAAKRPDDAAKNPGMAKVQVESFDVVKKISNADTSDATSIVILASAVAAAGVFFAYRKHR